MRLRQRLKHPGPARLHPAPVPRVQLVHARVITHLPPARGWVALTVTLRQVPQAPAPVVRAQPRHGQVAPARLVPVRVTTRSRPTKECAEARHARVVQVLVVPAAARGQVAPVPLQVPCPAVQHQLKAAQPVVPAGAVVPDVPVVGVQEPADPVQRKQVVPPLAAGHPAAAPDAVAPQALSAVPVVSRLGGGSRSGRSGLNSSRCKHRRWVALPYLGVLVTP